MAKSMSDKILLDVGIQNSESVKLAFDLLIQLGLKLLGADEGSLLVYRKKYKDLQFVSTIGGDSPKQLVGKTVPIGEGITGMAAMSGEIQTSTRASGSRFFEVPDDGKPNSVIAAPILLDDELIGVITAVSFDLDKSFSTVDCQKYAIVAELGAIVLRQEQQIASFRSEIKTSLTEQEALERKAVEQTINWLKKHPDKGDKIIQILTMLSEL
jgi:transcriptional regulator with GAF, ATPase, and Fis domain